MFFESTRKATAGSLQDYSVDAVAECLSLTIGTWDPPGKKRSTKSGYAENALLKKSLILHSEWPHRHFFMKNGLETKVS